MWRKFKDEQPEMDELVLVYCSKDRFIYSRWETHVYKGLIDKTFPFWARLTHPEFDKEKMERYLSIACAEEDYE